MKTINNLQLIVLIIIGTCCLIDISGAEPVEICASSREGGVIQIEPIALQFGKVAVGKSVVICGKCSLKNTSTEPVRVEGVSLSTSSSKAFCLHCPRTIILPANGEKTLTVLFSPQEVGPAVGYVEFYAGGEKYVIPLAGEGICCKETTTLKSRASFFAQAGDVSPVASATLDAELSPEALAVWRPISGPHLIAIAGKKYDEESPTMQIMRRERAGADVLITSRKILSISGETGLFNTVVGLILPRSQEPVFVAMNRSGLAYFPLSERELTLSLPKRCAGPAVASQMHRKRCYAIGKDTSNNLWLTRIAVRERPQWTEPQFRIKDISLDGIMPFGMELERVIDMDLVALRNTDTKIPEEIAVLLTRVRSGSPPTLSRRLLAIHPRISNDGNLVASLRAQKEITVSGRNAVDLCVRRSRNLLGRAHLTVAYQPNRLRYLTLSRSGENYSFSSSEFGLLAHRPQRVELLRRRELCAVLLPDAATTVCLRNMEAGGFPVMTREAISTKRAIGLATARERNLLYVATHRSSPAELWEVRADAGSGNNRCPLANAGPEIWVSTTNSSGAFVTLNGSGYDPDGDPLAFSWTAPGIVFDNPTSPSPSAQFPVGDTMVYLVVTDQRTNPAENLDSPPSATIVHVRLASTSVSSIWMCYE